MNAVVTFCSWAYIPLLALALLRSLPIDKHTVERLDSANILIVVAMLTQIVMLVAFLMGARHGALNLVLVAATLAVCAVIFAFNLGTANRLEREAGRR